MAASCQCAVSTVFLTASRLRRVRLVVRTQPSQGWYTGSTPVRAATANRKFRVFLTISWTNGDERTAPRQIVAKFEQRIRCSPHAVIRVHDSTGNVIEAHKHAAELKIRKTALLAGCRAFG